jgi:hypothetical protein
MARESVAGNGVGQAGGMTVGWQMDADGSGLGDSHRAGAREGVPPPAPPRSFLAERGELQGASKGVELRPAEGPPPPGPLPSQTARGEGENSIPLRRSFCRSPSPAQFAGEGRGGGRPRTQTGPFRRVRIHPSPEADPSRPAPLRLQGLPAGRRSYKIQRSANLPLRPPHRRAGAPRCAGRAPPPVVAGTSSRIRFPQPVLQDPAQRTSSRTKLIAGLTRTEHTCCGGRRMKSAGPIPHP